MKAVGVLYILLYIGLQLVPAGIHFLYYPYYCLTNIIVAVGLSIVNTTYKIYSAQIDSNNKFKAAIFTFTFDQGLFIITSHIFIISAPLDQMSYLHHISNISIGIYI